MCAAGDAAAQNAIRSADLPEADVLDLLAVAPQEPADRAAYLTLIGQDAQRQAMDPDGSLLALAYRAAATDVRERLRAATASEGDADMVRVLITGERRDRIAQISGTELDYLGRHLAEHDRWDELRRLALDLPLAEAAQAARLLPADQRTDLPSDLTESSPELLRATIDRLPREKMISHRHEGWVQASFSPDGSELAVHLVVGRANSTGKKHVENIRIATGEVTLCHREYQDNTRVLPRVRKYNSILHLGDEIVLRETKRKGVTIKRRAIIRVHPVEQRMPLEGLELMSDPARTSTGLVAVTSAGLVFIDRGSTHQRHVAVPRLGEAVRMSIKDAILSSPGGHPEPSRITTSPNHGLIAISGEYRILVLDEQGTILHEKPVSPAAPSGYAKKAPGIRWMSFLDPDSLAVLDDDGDWAVWRFSTSSTIRPKPEAAKGWRGIEALRGTPLDERFARALGDDDHHLFLTPDPSAPKPPGERRLHAVSPYADTIAVSTPNNFFPRSDLEVHSPHLPVARELLETPLLHTTPLHWERARKLRPRIGDPEVREALTLFESCLRHRFANEIALGTSPISPGTPDDISITWDESSHGE
ncbi:hypothetical protein [Actinomadura sp. 9N215]|uniref:hypothetical protein n=1 Tax=Actinomadura sp. 9N215 TaxID=3375150 RepID=UPI0037BA9B88